MINFSLLTHTKEIGKRSNTGQIVLEILGDAAEQVPWDRLNPPRELLEEIERGDVVLVYPGAMDERGSDLSGVRRVILIDGTWHEARKIHQRSPYLLELRRISLQTGEKSRYNLRKNQKESGLCTAECVIEVLRLAGEHEAADRLTERFLSFIRPAAAYKGTVAGDIPPEAV